MKSSLNLKKLLGADEKTLKRFFEIRNDAIAEAQGMNKKGKIVRAIGISSSSRDVIDTAQEESDSEFLLKTALDQLRRLGAKTELIPLRKYNIQYCKACYSTTNAQCHFYCSCYPRGTPAGDDMTNILYDKILESDIMIFATPVNNFKMSSKMALFLDRCISLDGSLAPADSKNPKNKALNIKHSKFIEIMADPKIPGSGYLRRFFGKVAGIIVTGHEEGAAMVISSLFMTLNHFGMLFPAWGNMYAMGDVMHSTHGDRSIIRSKAYQEEARMIASNTFKLAKAIRSLKNTDWEHDYSTN